MRNILRLYEVFWEKPTVILEKRGLKLGGIFCFCDKNSVQFNIEVTLIRVALEFSTI